MKWSEVLLTLCITGQILGFVIFLKGFFPVKEAVQGYATWDNTGDNLTGDVPPKKTFSRMVFILIDALRADFGLPEAGSHLPKMDFLSGKIVANETYSFIAKAHPPTVTLPRIKALTTGGIPGFIDVVLNFDSKSLAEDNIITQLERAGQKVVFYGDDTWMRLFPGHFIRTDGTTSFFVTDYTEVDNNVTRHLASEFSENPDWDVLILHYLGLDHIGHLAGPKSPLVKPKLKEMDDIVKQIYESVKNMDERSVVFICGDHGMSDQGSHGGSSPSETLTPFVFLSPLYEKQQGQSFQKDRDIYQIDLAPTLSLLLGLPVPQNSLGTLIVDLFNKLQPKEKLQMSHINAKQIVKVFKQNTPQYERDNSYLTYQRALKQHESWLELFSANQNSRQTKLQLEELSEKVLLLYKDSMTGMRTAIASSLAEYDLHAMGVGIAVIWMILFLQIRLHHSFCSDSSGVNLSYSAVTVASLAEAVYIGLHTTLCTSVYKSGLLCTTGSHTWVVNLVPTVILWVFVLELWKCILSWRSWTMQEDQDKNRSDQNITSQRFLVLFLLLGTVVHTLSMLSSSFIEEEHQTRYFLTVTLHIGICFVNFRNYVLTDAAYTLHDEASENLTSQSQTDECPCVLEKQGLELQNFSFSKKKNLNSSQKEILKNQGGNLMKEDGFQSKVFSDNSSVRERADESKHQPSVKDGVEGVRNVTEKSVCQLISKDRLDDHLMDDNSKHQLNKKDGVKFLQHLAGGVVVLVLCRVCRTWNRTGDKWAHLPDIGDWLIRPENKMVLSSVSALSLLILAAIIKKKFNFMNWLLFCGGALCVYMFRAANGDLICPGIYDSQTKSKGVIEARCVYIVILLLFLHSLYQLKQKLSKATQSSQTNSQQPFTPQLLTVIFDHIQLGFLLLMLLLVRPHNISLVAMEFVQILLVHKISLLMNLSVLGTSLLYMWMGQAAFFYQGNSNSLTSVDVSAGYVGIESYNPTVIGILLAFATFAGPLMWYISLISVLGHKMIEEWGHSDVDVKKINSRFLRQLSQAILTVSLTRSLPMSLYVVLVTTQRYHLFVWTVFSPKLLYEGMHALVLGLCNILLIIMKNLCALNISVTQ